MCCCFTAVGLRCCAFDSALAHLSDNPIPYAYSVACQSTLVAHSAHPSVVVVWVWGLVVCDVCHARSSPVHDVCSMYCLILRNWMRGWCQFDGLERRFYEAINSSIDAHKHKVIWHAFYDYDSPVPSSCGVTHEIIVGISSCPLPTTNSKLYSPIKTWLFIQSHIREREIHFIVHAACVRWIAISPAI